MSSQETNIKLQLKDIIEIIAPSNPDLHNKRYLIDYIDSYEIRIVSIDDINEPVITLTIGPTGVLDNKSITEINLLSRDDKIGYARQNGLLPDVLIDIFFIGDEELIVSGKISDLVEDMIEILLEDGSIIYIDFAYKGIPKDIPIDKIVK